ncbi:MAG: trimeric intracellular cation channel family protein [Niabella sp.]
MGFIDVVTYIGIFAFSIAGALKARTAKLDVFGGFVVAFVSSYGGGTIRDLLLGIRPVNWINDNFALTLVFAGTAITFLVKNKLSSFRRTIFITDAIGLGLFTAAGIEIAASMGVNDIYALVMGVITATFGGLLADIMCSYPPSLLRKGELYATVCLIGGIIFILVNKFLFFPRNVDLFICIVTVVVIRIYSKRKRLMLPNI